MLSLIYSDKTESVLDMMVYIALLFGGVAKKEFSMFRMKCTLIFLALNAILTNCADLCSLHTAERLESDRRIDEAIECYQSLFQTKDSSAAFERLSHIYAKRGDYDEAIAYGKRVFGSDQRNLHNKLSLGDWHFKKNQVDKALNYFLMVERADSLFPALNYNLAVVYLTAFDSPKLARKHIEREVRNYGYSEENLALLGQVFFQLNLFENSEIAFSRVIKAQPSNPTYFFQRAILYYYWDKYAEAISDIDTAIMLDPQFVDAMLLKIDIGLEINASFVCEVISQVENYSTLPEELLKVKNECFDN